MTAWLLIWMAGLSEAVVPGIATRVECERLAVAMQVQTYECHEYKAALQ